MSFFPVDSNHLINAELVVVSDIHIRSNADANFHLLLQTMQSCSQKVRFFVFLGDIFDFCFGRSRLHRQQYHPLCEAIDRLHNQGCQVIFLEGNHEFDLKSLGWKNLRIVSDITMKLQMSDKTVIAFSHGDLFNSPWHYKIFRRFIKSRFAFMAAGLIADKLFDKFALNLAHGSRSLDKYRQLDHEAILRDASQWLRATNADFGFFGHFHVPYAENLHPNVPADQTHQNTLRVICCDSWQKPNAICFDKKKVFRLLLKENSEANIAELESFLTVSFQSNS